MFLFCLVIIGIFWDCVLLVSFRQWDLLQFVLEEVPLVEKHDEGCFSEEDIVEHVSKELLSFQHSVCGFVLPQHLVVVAQRDDEHDCNEKVEQVESLKKNLQ